MDHFSEACNEFGLTTSTKKTKVMYQPAPQKAYSEPTIRFGNETLKVTDRFCYLGRTLSRFANIDAEIDNRIAKARSALDVCRKRLGEERNQSAYQGESVQSHRHSDSLVRVRDLDPL